MLCRNSVYIGCGLSDSSGAGNEAAVVTLRVAVESDFVPSDDFNFARRIRICAITCPLLAAVISVGEADTPVNEIPRGRGGVRGGTLES